MVHFGPGHFMVYFSQSKIQSRCEPMAAVEDVAFFSLQAIGPNSRLHLLRRIPRSDILKRIGPLPLERTLLVLLFMPWLAGCGGIGVGNPPSAARQGTAISASPPATVRASVATPTLTSTDAYPTSTAARVTVTAIDVQVGGTQQTIGPHQTALVPADASSIGVLMHFSGDVPAGVTNAELVQPSSVPASSWQVEDQRAPRRDEFAFGLRGHAGGFFTVR